MSESIAIVVGGGELGRAVAAELVGTAGPVVVVDRNEQNLSQVPDGVHAEVADPTDPAVVAPTIDRIVAERGVPSVLVNTVGAFWPGDALTTTPEQLRTMLDVNLGTALWLSQAVAAHMKTTGSGAIVHVSARPGLEAMPGMAAYAASKAALTHLIRLLDVELRPLGIRVNGVAPQLIDTERNRDALPKEAMAQAISPQAVAGIIAFLVGEAASAISGAILPAYGGGR
jgi:NAD(P)-dependent dehydrogenase (short-subunit alcohol dehydrogenase family)